VSERWVIHLPVVVSDLVSAQRLMPGGRQCLLRPDHDGECSRRFRRR
jgi:hypothetical protein